VLVAVLKTSRGFRRACLAVSYTRKGTMASSRDDKTGKNPDLVCKHMTLP
jgi:hypothetical protein